MPSNRKSDRRKPKWEGIAAEAQQYRDDSVDRAWRTSQGLLPPNTLGNVITIPPTILSEKEIQITSCSSQELLARIASRQVTSVAVLSAFLHRAAIAQKLTNCVTELLPETALRRTEALDSHLERHGTTIGPLHGLPISVKEMMGMEGLRQTAGYCASWSNTASSDAHLLRILWDAGAVFHARTTEPQTMMSLECYSILWGRTLNPWNTQLSSGGSSGGEAALLAMRGSPLGIGTDVGGEYRLLNTGLPELERLSLPTGSIRTPAAYCGLFGLKPTSFRIPTDGWSSIAAAADSVVACVGPMSTSLDDLSLFMKVVIGSKPWLHEPSLIPLPWIPVTLSTIRIGIMKHDGVVMPHPPIQRALTDLETQLRHIINIEVVDWLPHAHDEAWAIQSSLYFPDGGAADRAVMAQTAEPILPLTRWMLEQNPAVKPLTTSRLFYWMEEREAYRTEYARLWQERGVDAVLCPAAPGAAPRHDTSTYWGYTAVWNLLDYPAVVFPAAKVEEVDRAYERDAYLSGKDEEEWAKYDHETFRALPVGLQLVCPRFGDEKLLAILEHIHCHVQLPMSGG